MPTQVRTNQSLPVEEMASRNEKLFYQKPRTSVITLDEDIPAEQQKLPDTRRLDQEGWKGHLTYAKKSHKLKDPAILMLDLFAEFSGFTVFLILNVTALVGLRKSKALFLLPWIIVYLISIFASYTTFSFLLIMNLVSDSVINWKIFLPLATGITFHLGWILVKSVFEDFKKQMPRSEQSGRSQVGHDITSHL